MHYEICEVFAFHFRGCFGGWGLFPGIVRCSSSVGGGGGFCVTAAAAAVTLEDAAAVIAIDWGDLYL